MIATLRPAGPAPATIGSLDPESLSDATLAAFGIRLEFALARNPLAPGDLALGEQARYGSIGHPARREEWLRGRAALKSLLRRLGHAEDTSLLAFPHPRLSLTHSADLALAVASTDPALRGLGVDFESHRPVKAGMERFFLTDAERGRLDLHSDMDLLRLWTVKEALFKADPLNRAGEGRHLWSYSVPGSLQARQGSAQGPGDSRFRYLTLATIEGFLAVALLTSSGAPA